MCYWIWLRAFYYLIMSSRTGSRCSLQSAAMARHTIMDLLAAIATGAGLSGSGSRTYFCSLFCLMDLAVICRPLRSGSRRVFWLWVCRVLNGICTRASVQSAVRIQNSKCTCWHIQAVFEPISPAFRWPTGRSKLKSLNSF